MPKEIKIQVLRNRNDFLVKVKSHNFSRRGYENVKCIDEIKFWWEISRTEYEAVLSISEDINFKLYLKGLPNDCCLNNYFLNGLLPWEANLNVQPVFSHYIAPAYTCAYLSKWED